MTYARWSQNPLLWASSSPPTTFSSDGTQAICVNGSGAAASISGTGKYVCGIHSNSTNPQQLGIINNNCLISSGGFAGISTNQANQLFFGNGSGGNIYQYDLGGSWAGYTYIAVDMTALLVWISNDGTNWYGASGSARAASDVAAGTDGIAWGTFPGVTSGYGSSIFVDANSGTTTFTIINSFGFGLPSGYSALPATLNLVSVNPFNEGSNVPINWTGGSLSGLNGVIDGTSVSLTGVNTGSGGLALGPVETTTAAHTLRLSDPNYPVDETAQTTFAAFGPISTYMVPDPNFIGSLNLGAVSISSNSLAITLPTGNANVQVIGNDPTSTGAYYFEFTLGANWGGYAAVGIMDALFDPGITGGNTIRGSLNHGVIWIENGAIYLNGTTSVSIPSHVPGSTYCVAVDFGANLIWFQQAGGQWNGSGTANPATGTGGIDISALTGPFVPVLAYQGGYYGTTTFNFGHTTFTGTLPSGFTNWPLSATTYGSRVSQTGMDSLKDNTTTNVRISYESIESINAQTTANARVSYESVESLVYLDNTNARASQIVLQVLTPVFVPMTGANTNIMIVT